MEKLTVYYSVGNGGDGSAYPHFMESGELCEWDQEHMDEGWGESCTGSISFESESPIVCTEDIETKEAYLISRYITEYAPNDSYGPSLDIIKEFISKFFPDGLPTFTCKKTENRESYNSVLVGDKVVAKVFAYGDTKEPIKLQEMLNSFEIKYLG